MSDDVKRWVGSSAVALGLVAAVVVGWILVSGTGGGGGGPTTSRTSVSPTGDVSSTASSPTPSPSVSTSYINAAPGETPPVRPPDELSEAGLEAFIRYFAETIDWAVATMDPTLLAQASTSACGFCSSMISTIKDDVAAGRRYEGSRYTLTKVVIYPDLTGGDGRQRTAGFLWDATAYTVYAMDGSIVRQDPPVSGIENSVGARFTNGGWSVVDLHLVRSEG